MYRSHRISGSNVQEFNGSWQLAKDAKNKCQGFHGDFFNLLIDNLPLPGLLNA